MVSFELIQNMHKCHITLYLIFLLKHLQYVILYLLFKLTIRNIFIIYIWGLMCDLKPHYILLNVYNLLHIAYKVYRNGCLITPNYNKICNIVLLIKSDVFTFNLFLVCNYFIMITWSVIIIIFLFVFIDIFF